MFMLLWFYLVRTQPCWAGMSQVSLAWPFSLEGRVMGYARAASPYLFFPCVHPTPPRYHPHQQPLYPGYLRNSISISLLYSAHLIESVAVPISIGEEVGKFWGIP